jgi:hypothetical protein
VWVDSRQVFDLPLRQLVDRGEEAAVALSASSSPSMTAHARSGGVLAAGARGIKIRKSRSDASDAQQWLSQ